MKKYSLLKYKKNYKGFLLFTIFCSISQSAFSVNAYITSKAKIIDSTSIYNTGNGLKFGTISAGNSGGTVNLPADETPIQTTGELTSKGGASIDKFTITGEKNVTVNLSIPATLKIYLNGNTGLSDIGKQMNININTNLAGRTITFDDSGSYTFNVGGVLQVKPE